MGALTGLLGVGGGAGGTTFGGPAAASQQGNNNMQQAYNMLQGVASGTGPNPAQAQYQNNIQGLAKQQAGAIGSVQGISPALAARLASQQGSSAMQNAAGMGAVAQGQQQLGAMGAMGNIGGMQQGAANQMMGNINTTNAGLAQTTMQGQQGIIGGLFGGAGTAMGAMAPAAAAGGGEAGADFGAPVSSYSSPGMSIPISPPPAQQAQTQSLLSQFLSGQQAGQQPISGPAAIAKGMTTFGSGLRNQMNSPSTPPVDSSGGDSSLPSAYGSDAVMPSGNPVPNPAELGFARGGMTRDFRSGGSVKAGPGQKAVKGGNSYANDKIPALLSEGEVVIPRNVMQSADPVRSSADFVAKVIAKRRMGK